jgi:hypothetical protein
MTEANYNGRQPNNTAYIKTFIEAIPPDLWTISNINNVNVLQPTDKDYDSVYIPGNLYVDGIIVNPANKKENILPIINETSNALYKIACNQYTLNNDTNKTIHYGLDATELEKYIPNLVYVSPYNKNDKTINYLEIIPLLLNQIKNMQLQIDTLTNEINVIKEIIQEEKW